MIINYYSEQLIKFIQQNKPFVLSSLSTNDLDKFIETRVKLAEAEFETQRKNGFNVISAQESAIYVLFDGIITNQESYLKTVIEENFPNISEALHTENKLNNLIQKVLPVYLNLLEHAKTDEKTIAYEVIAEIENIIQHNGI